MTEVEIFSKTGPTGSFFAVRNAVAVVHVVCITRVMIGYGVLPLGLDLWFRNSHFFSHKITAKRP
jgi:hypothetical protein